MSYIIHLDRSFFLIIILSFDHHIHSIINYVLLLILSYYSLLFSHSFIQPPSIFCHPQANCFHRRLLVTTESPSLSPGSPPNNYKDGYTENKSEIKQSFSPLARVLSELTPENNPSRTTWDMKEGDTNYSESIGSSECKVTNDNQETLDKENNNNNNNGNGKDIDDDRLTSFSPNSRRDFALEAGTRSFELFGNRFTF